MARNGADVPGRFDKLEAKQALLDQLIRVKALAGAGRELGYDKDAEMEEIVDRFLADKYLRELNRINPPPPTPSSQEIQKYWDDHKAEYTPPERARASIIVLRFPPQATDEQRKAVQARAQVVRAQALERAAIPGTFLTLAKEQSEDAPSRARGGDIGWLPKGAKDYRLDSHLVEAIFAIENLGDIGPLVETLDGVVVVRLTERTKAEPKPLSEVEGGIRQTLLAERQKALSDQRMKQLAERFPATVNRDALAKIGPPPRDKDGGARPPSFPVGAP